MNWQEFQGAAASVGVTLDDAQLAALERYYGLVLEGNRRASLTSITDPERFLVTHLLDSLSIARALDGAIGGANGANGNGSGGDGDGGGNTGGGGGGGGGAIGPGPGPGPRPLRRAIDVGTGAGFPSVPLAIAFPGLSVSAVESIRKKCEFLRGAARELGLSPGRLEVLEGRAEELARRPDMRDAYDLAVARALAPLPVVIELCAPFLRPGGVLVAMKGPKVDEELARSGRALEELGAELESVLPSGVPGLDTRLVKVRKVRETPERYPRRTGVPEKRAL